ncbi:MAG: hypothetical protein M1383_03470 [Patescibacteria group bacterium]|nr:hypothetical protein [Patescibacteria group bacterium]
MTFKKLAIYTFWQLFLLIALKVLFFKYWGFNNSLFSFYYWIAVMVITAAAVRRLGVINFLESMFVAIFWFLLDLFFDLLITSLFTGFALFSYYQFWTGYFVFLVMIFLAHKKRHIAIRHEQAKHHGHH